ncbi:MAG TPA: hypothetical protein VJ912_00065 [Candidatus Nanoarchaeia archaeon]|nr:hypothetical protein [Candidatus Nanoarchaeia archaeon]
MVQVKTVDEIIQNNIPYYKKKGEPEAEHTIVYDSSSEQLEPIYFFILDLMNDFGLKPKKVLDNFSASPGSGHFSEMGQRASLMQQQGQKLLTDVNNLVRSVLNIIYDLREFKTFLQPYDDLKSDDKDKRESARLSLKQRWMDKVDMQKGNSSIKQMALTQAGFTTLIDAFLAAKDETLKDEKGNKIDVNERVRRILKDRIREFNSWIKNSEQEIRKRYAIERNYLKSQVNSLKLYMRWAKPYLKAAQQLESKQIGGSEPALVKTFDTIILELSLFGKQTVDIEGEYSEGNAPKELVKMDSKGKLRKYYKCIFVDFRFRSIPQKISQQSGYSYGGRSEITFKAYSMNEDEVAKFEEELSKSDIEDAMSLVEAATEESLGQIQEDINEFLKEEEKESKENKEKKQDTSNPFLALFGAYNKKSSKSKEESKENKEKTKQEKEKALNKETWIEKEYLRPLTKTQAAEMAFSLHDIYKKSHGMASFT